MFAMDTADAGPTQTIDDIIIEVSIEAAILVGTKIAVEQMQHIIITYGNNNK